MQIKFLTRAEAKEIYQTRMLADFPAAELKPFSAITEMLDAGMYEPLALTDDAGSLQAYAWQVALPAHRCALLDYFAVRADLRGGGVGTAALQALRAHYAPRFADLILEVEHPAEAPAPETARRRIGFYLRAGARATEIESRVFGVRYKIMALSCGKPAPDAELSADLQALYRAMVPEPYYRGNVIFYGN